MPKATRPTMSSAGCGRRGRASGQPTPSAAFTDARTTSLPYLSIKRKGVESVSSACEDEDEHETEDGEGLGERHAGEGDGLEHAAGLGLTRDAVDVGGEDQTHTDTGADGGEAVAEVGDVPSHCGSFRGRRVRPGVGVFLWSCGGAYEPGPVVSGAR